MESTTVSKSVVKARAGMVNNGEYGQVTIAFIEKATALPSVYFRQATV
jgi:hypothetical protein